MIENVTEISYVNILWCRIIYCPSVELSTDNANIITYFKRSFWKGQLII